MSIKFKNMLRALSLLVLLSSFVPLNHPAQAAAALPPVDMFQLPWEQGKAWVALDGFDNGSRRAAGSPHNYLNGGAVDFAPHNNMLKGENTSNFWVAAVADGTIVEISKCHMKIAHANGWVSEYQHLANIQVKLGDVVARNQKLAVIANASTQPVCPGSEPPDIPHLHFALRPNMVGATFAGWEFRYNWFWNNTTFRKNGQTLGLYKPLLNVFDSVPTPTPVTQPTNTPTPVMSPTPTIVGTYVSTAVNPQSINVGETALVTVSLNNVPVDGFASAEFTCPYADEQLEVSNIVVAPLFGTDAVTAINGPLNRSFIVAIAGSHGNKATTSGIAFTFNVKGLQAGQTALACTARVSTGNNVLTDIPHTIAFMTIVGSIPTLDLTPSVTPTAFSTPVSTTTTMPPSSDWLNFTNVTYGFQFSYPPQGEIQAGSNDGDTRINNLPIAQPGTNLSRKFMEVFVGQNVTACKSQQVQDPGVTVTINGIPFLKQTGAQGAAGSLFQLVEYSTLRDGVCVNLEFVLQSHDPSFFPTPPPVFDYATETAIFDQIIATYTWLALVPPTATPTFTFTPAVSPTPTFTSTPVESPTPIFSPTTTPISGAVLTGQVIATKVVTVRLYGADQSLISAVNANLDGTFRFDVPAGTYTIVATANGFLRIEGSVALADGDNHAMPAIALLAGDIDDNNAIDQFDAMTIGMSYNTAEPPSADLNNDGIVNVLDLELLARNYRKMGPVVWQ
jgi:murein DD-endopeptidase MepM/ murein hydrolase activator NlpD